MYYLFRSDGTFQQSEYWIRSKTLKDGEIAYMRDPGNDGIAFWYMLKKDIGATPVNYSDVPEQYHKMFKLLQLVSPKPRS